MATMNTILATRAPRPDSSYSIAEKILETARRRSEHVREAAQAQYTFSDRLIAGAYANMHRLAADAMDLRIQRLGYELDDIVNRRARTEAIHTAPEAAVRQHNISVDWMEVLGAELVDPKAIA